MLGRPTHLPGGIPALGGVLPSSPQVGRDRAHFCHKYHKLYLWRKICLVEKFQISEFEQFWLHVYFSKAHPWDRRYSARIKTSNIYIWAPVNPITQSTIVWNSNLCAAKFSHNNSDPVTAFHFAMSVGAKHQYLAEVSLHLTGFPETIQKMDCELRQVGSAPYSDIEMASWSMSHCQWARNKIIA